MENHLNLCNLNCKSKSKINSLSLPAVLMNKHLLEIRGKKQTHIRAYFRHLLHMVPTHNVLFDFVSTISHSKNCKSACWLGVLIFELP